jgi:hypothetical protein
MRDLKEFSKLIDDFAQDVNFITVYLEEAHPLDGWKFEGNYDIYQHKLGQDRLEAANILHTKIIQNFGQKRAEQMPIYLDLMNNQFTQTFAAFPERLLVIEGDKLTFISGAGPYFYNIPLLRLFLLSKISR